MTKSLNFGLKIKGGGGVVGRVAHAKSSDPVTPPKKNHTCTFLQTALLKFIW